MATLLPSGGKVKLARGGIQTPRDEPSANDWVLKALLERQPGDTYIKRQPIPFSDTHETAADLAFLEHETKLGFEYDWKRELVNPIMRTIERPDLTPVTEHLAAGSRPWRSLDEFLSTRELFDSWRLKHDGQLKTLADWEAWENYLAGAAASRAGVRRSRKGVVDQARRMLVRAWVRGLWGLPPLRQQGIADLLTKAGYTTSLNDVKKAKTRDGDPKPHTIPAGGPGVREFIRAVLCLCPTFEHRQLVDQEIDLNAADLPLQAAE